MLEERNDILSLVQWQIFSPGIFPLIAGPCSAESRDQVFQTAKSLSEIGVKVFRAGLWKPRTHPFTFQGCGEEGLEWLREASSRYGMIACTEVACGDHVQACLENGITMMWIGARTSSNPFLVQQIADKIKNQDVIVLVKNPIGDDFAAWAGALERLYWSGVRKLAGIHRGIPASNSFYRNDPSWPLLVRFKTVFPHIPLFCDPSHIAGDKKYVKDIAQRALKIGADGLMIESHTNPLEALSDKNQQLTPVELKTLICELLALKCDLGKEDKLTDLREEIDIIDENILNLLARRMRICSEIGIIKKNGSLPIIQPDRWETVLKRVMELGLARGLSQEFVRKIFQFLHSESVRLQDENDQ